MSADFAKQRELAQGCRRKGEPIGDVDCVKSEEDQAPPRYWS